MQGRSWSEVLNCSDELRNSWAEAIHRFVYGTILRFSLFNADPHPGNYLFHDDGSVSFLDFGCVKRLKREQVEAIIAVGRACLREDVRGTWQACVESGFCRSTDPVTPEEVYKFWRESWELYWAQQPFTVTPEHAAQWIARKYSPTGPSANAFRYFTASPEYAAVGRIELSATSLIAELHPTNHWASMGAEFFEGAIPQTELGKLDHEFFEDRPRALPLTSL